MSLQVHRVASSRDRRRFITCQWQFYRSDPNWVPPLISERFKILDTDRNPFYKHARVALFLATEDGQVVGRIAALTNELHNEIHHDTVGFFGFFECTDRQDVAHALFAAAEEWLRGQGKTGMRGPVNPSMNDECGLLIVGFDEPPSIMMTYNPRYYAALIENEGFVKVKDLYSYRFVEESYESEKLARLHSVVRERNKISVREVDFKNKKQYARDLETLKWLYNAVWEPNWGFVKMTDAEFDHLAKDLRQIADQRYALIAEVDGQVAGFILAVPDINQVLIHNRTGRILPVLWHMLTKRKRINNLRTMVLGLLPQYRRTGADAVLYYEIGKRGVENGMTQGEAGWVLEDNVEMNNVMTHGVHGDRFKTYRIYQKDWA